MTHLWTIDPQFGELLADFLIIIHIHTVSRIISFNEPMRQHNPMHFCSEMSLDLLRSKFHGSQVDVNSRQVCIVLQVETAISCHRVSFWSPHHQVYGRWEHRSRSSQLWYPRSKMALVQQFQMNSTDNFIWIVFFFSFEKVLFLIQDLISAVLLICHFNLLLQPVSIYVSVCYC